MTLLLRSSDPAAQEAQQDVASVEEIHSELDALAKSLAQSLSAPGYRQALLAHMKKSKTREKILRMHEFTESMAKKKDMPPKANAKGLEKQVKSTREKFRGPKFMALLGTADIDVYFPVDEQRHKWSGKDDLLVAYVPVIDEADVTDIIAYSVKTGDRVILDPASPPDTPTLVIAICEHEGEHELDVPPPEQTMQDEPGEDPGEQHNSYFAMSKIKLYHDGEPWTKGDPEIYVLSAHVHGGEVKCKYSNLPFVNDEEHWYWCRVNTEFYFDSNSSNETFFMVMERDGSCSARCGGWSNQCKFLQVRVGGRTATLGYNKGDDPIYPYPEYYWSRGLINKAAIPWKVHTKPSWDGAPFNDSRYLKAMFYKRP
jgi:hypothetical protein